jgi:hypothetical protein
MAASSTCRGAALLAALLLGGCVAGEASKGQGLASPAGDPAPIEATDGCAGAPWLVTGTLLVRSDVGPNRTPRRAYVLALAEPIAAVLGDGPCRPIRFVQLAPSDPATQDTLERSVGQRQSFRLAALMPTRADWHEAEAASVSFDQFD